MQIEVWVSSSDQIETDHMNAAHAFFQTTLTQTVSSLGIKTTRIL